jgi:hypothetical protein
MHAALLNSSLSYALTVVAGLLMVRIASALQRWSRSIGFAGARLATGG